MRACLYYLILLACHFYNIIMVSAYNRSSLTLQKYCIMKFHTYYYLFFCTFVVTTAVKSVVGISIKLRIDCDLYRVDTVRKSSGANTLQVAEREHIAFLFFSFSQQATISNRQRQVWWNCPEQKTTGPPIPITSRVLSDTARRRFSVFLVTISGLQFFFLLSPLILIVQACLSPQKPLAVLIYIPSERRLSVYPFAILAD